MSHAGAKVVGYKSAAVSENDIKCDITSNPVQLNGQNMHISNVVSVWKLTRKVDGVICQWIARLAIFAIYSAFRARKLAYLGQTHYMHEFNDIEGNKVLGVLHASCIPSINACLLISNHPIALLPVWKWFCPTHIYPSAISRGMDEGLKEQLLIRGLREAYSFYVFFLDKQSKTDINQFQKK
jgi:hypothetical protein